MYQRLKKRKLEYGELFQEEFGIKLSKYNSDKKILKLLDGKAVIIFKLFLDNCII
jgi:hypothetical protein